MVKRTRPRCSSSRGLIIRRTVESDPLQGVAALLENWFNIPPPVMEAVLPEIVTLVSVVVAPDTCRRPPLLLEVLPLIVVLIRVSGASLPLTLAMPPPGKPPVEVLPLIVLFRT